MAEIRSHLDHYAPASLRGVTAVKDGWICTSFSQAGQVVRLRLPVEDALRAAEFVDFYLEKDGVQSPRSSGIPSVLGSQISGQSVYPPATSSAAACGSWYEPSRSPLNMACHLPSDCSVIQKVPRRVAWLYAIGLIVVSFVAGAYVATAVALPVEKGVAHG